jgi:ankyrin repeat protein
VLNDETAFHVAIRNKNSSGVTHLLSYVEKIDVSSLEIKDKNGKTALHSVFEAEMELEVIEKMVEKLNPENSNLKPFFEKFADQPGSIKLLLNFIKPDIQDLNSAIQSNFSETVNILLNEGSIKPDQTSIELIAKNGLSEVLKNIPEEHLIKSQNSLLIAIKSGNFPETADLLLEKSVCELQNSELYNTLILEENVPAMKYLINKGALIKLLTNDLEVLLACTRMGDEEILSKLLSDSDELLTSFHHSAAMWQALTIEKSEKEKEKCQNGCDLAALLLSSYSACVDAELDGQLLIQRAIEQKLESAACFLIDSSCTISEEERETPFSAIHQAAELQLDRVIQSLLLRPDIKPNSIFNGETPLHISIQNVDLHSAMILLSYPEIDVSIATSADSNETALTICARLCSEFGDVQQKIKNIYKIADRILAFGEEKADPFDKLGRSVLHKILQDDRNPNQLENFQFYLHFLDENKQTRDGVLATSLHIAISLGNVEAVKILLQQENIDVNRQNKSGHTPLHVTTKHPSLLPIAELLVQEKSTDYTIRDNKQMNIWSSAMYHCNFPICVVLAKSMTLETCLILSADKSIKKRNAVHLLCKYSTQNQDNASKILQILLDMTKEAENSENDKNHSGSSGSNMSIFGSKNGQHVDIFNESDEDGNTPLLLAYEQGNAVLCENLVSFRNVCLASTNLEGDSIFTLPAANDRLLTRILKSVNGREPPWNKEVESKCAECTKEFGIFTLKRHHCRHCGRAVCQACCHSQMKVIDKFHDKTPKRLCEKCYLLV